MEDILKYVDKKGFSEPMSIPNKRANTNLKLRKGDQLPLLSPKSP